MSCAATWLACLASFVVTGCDRTPPETRHRFTAMGTLVEVTVFDHPAETATEAALEIESLFLELEHRWDPWDDGELGALNAAVSAGEDSTPGPDLARLVGRASELARKSDGMFDPTVGELVRLWGFDDADRIPERPPPAAEIRRALDSQAPLPTLWDAADGTLRGHEGVTIDLGGFAKGVAVDRAIALLHERGVDNAIVNAGGDLRAIGRRGDRPWKIGVRAPRGGGILAAIEISGDESVFTSGDYERFFDFQGRRFHHILDPRTGYPTLGLVSVTVVHDDAATADAACTALMVAGPERWPAVAKALGIRHVMVVDADGRVHIGRGTEARVTILDEGALPIAIRELQ
jgi:thiamine biosynthesis lipoprotein